MSCISRHPDNPLIKPSDISPSVEGYQVLGAFNPGAVEFNGEILLLLRVAESCIKEDGYVSVPYYSISENSVPENSVSENSILEDKKFPSPNILKVKEDDPGMELKDTRGVFYKETDYLSTVSHLRLARSKDGIHFQVDDKPFLYPTMESESFGVEDARITPMGDQYWINYTGVSKDGFYTMLAVTKDFVTVEKKGIIFPPMNKDVAFFNELFKGEYCCLHRPNNYGFGHPSIWMSRSPDLQHWGKHTCLLRPEDSRYERMKIGGGAPPVKTEEGWLSIYHGKGDHEKYVLNTLLLDLENPEKILGKGKDFLLEPEEPYETDGFFGNVVFTNGMVIKEEGDKRMVWIYYGASDETTCLAIAPLDDLVDHALGRG